MTFELSNFNTTALPIATLQHSVPAAFADRAYVNVGVKYVFISTAQLIEALMDAGLEAVNARQTRARGDRHDFARHMIRFRQRGVRPILQQAVPEVILVNAHDMTSSYQLRAGLFRPICENGLMCSIGDFGLVHIPHRGVNVLDRVIEGARTLVQGFDSVNAAMSSMLETTLNLDRQRAFAADAARIRYKDATVPYDTHRLLEARRALDQGDDAWHVYNRVQENIIRGGIPSRTATGRATRTRGIRAIREDVRINTALWHLAMNLLRG